MYKEVNSKSKHLEIVKQFFTQEKKRHTLGLFCLLRTGTVGTKALKTENDAFIPNIRVKIQFETRNLAVSQSAKVHIAKLLPMSKWAEF